MVLSTDAPTPAKRVLPPRRALFVAHVLMHSPSPPLRFGWLGARLHGRCRRTCQGANVRRGGPNAPWLPSASGVE